ncbi:MAG: hypothetical protein ACP6IS_02350 [Candidatus Asgardarchaeia archaeon]
MVNQIHIDFWATSLHGEEIGIKQKEQWISKSRQFTKDMDIYGKIIRDKEDFGIVAFRTRALEKENRLVVRAFTDRGAWIGSLEELLSKEIRNTVLLNEPTLSYAIIQPDYDYVTVIDRIIKRGLFQREYYVFDIFIEKGTIETYTLESARVSLGSDFSVRRENDGKKVATIDSKVLNIGGAVEIKFHDDKAKENQVLERILIMFAAGLRFADEQKRKIERLVKEFKEEKKAIKIPKEELALYENPRRIKY